MYTSVQRERSEMKPLQRVHAAAAYFAAAKAGANPVYHFDVPAGVNMESHTNTIRKHARQLGYEWSVIYYKVGRAWIIKKR